MKKIGLFLITLMLIVIYSECSKLTVQAKLDINMQEMRRREDEKKEDDKKDDDKKEKEEKKDVNIIYKGWIKFQLIKFSAEMDSEMKYFEINQSYFKGASSEQDEADEYGPINIPDDQHFFGIMNDKTLYITTGRKNDVIRTYKSIEFEFIRDIVYKDGGMMTGGLMSLPDVKPKEYCFKLRLRNKMTWVMCSDTMEEKANWMKHIMKYLKTSQESDDEDGDGARPPQDIKVPPMKKGGAANEKEDDLDLDGKWMIIHQWSECTLACGGGDSFLQRRCVGRRGKGRKCVGEEILSKKCNTDPCPGEIKKQEKSDKPAMIQMARLSNRPQRYERCLVREGDVNLRVDETQPEGVMPVRLVLNNRTISIFYNVEYESVYQSYDLQFLTASKDKYKPDWCVRLQDNRDEKKNTAFCIHPANLKPENTPAQETQKWLDDILDFKTKCSMKPTFHEVDNGLFKERKDLINKEKQEEELSKLREADQKNQNMFDEKTEDDASKMIVDEVKKEIQFDSMAMQDELLREKKESDQLESSINVQEEKSACLDKSMARKQKLVEIQLKEKETQERVQDLKKQAQEEVESSRQRTLKKIQMYRALADRRKFLKKEKLLQMKVSLATRLLNDQRKGDMALCMLSVDPKDQKTYCENSFSDFKEKLEECKSSPMLFCFNCCEYEFGAVHEKDRDECYDQCIQEPQVVSIFLDPKKEKGAADKKDKKGF